MLAAEQPGRDRGGLLQLADHPLLADEVAEDRRAAHRRVPVHARHPAQSVQLNPLSPIRSGQSIHAQSTIAGKLPVFASANGGTGSGSMSRTRSWVARPTSSGDWDASSTR